MPHKSTRGEEIDGINLRSNKMRNAEKNMLNIREKDKQKVILNIKATHATQYFQKQIDALSIIHTCTTCMDSYPGISTHPYINGPICNQCHKETNGHRFSKWNNMDPGTQPIVLSILTQVEEMIIARISPILQVIHARGGQCKYSGHIISFPQQIVQISNCVP